MMIGEKYLRPDDYETGDNNAGDNQSCYAAVNSDANRWGNRDLPPYQDTPGMLYQRGFGSAHAMAFHIGQKKSVTIGIQRSDGIKVATDDVVGHVKGRKP